jgi:hypothetical protein
VMAVDARPIPARLPEFRGSLADGRSSEAPLGWLDREDRRTVAVMITADGRRVHVPIDPAALPDVSLLDILRSLPGLDSLLGLISGSRRDRGSGRDERH